ncbi:MAG: hypothetical protein C0609_03250 [Deltaproteobacteria bacterium]|nr:MAG: hypothetical protein C0609_03250 [Deltaproteobacteria bacterium]
MRIACLDCETNYEIPADKIDPAGQLVECCRCGLVFGVKPKETPITVTASKQQERTGLGALFYILLLILIALLAYLFVVKPNYLKLISGEGLKRLSSVATSQPAPAIEPSSAALVERVDGSKILVVTGWTQTANLKEGDEGTVTLYAGDTPVGTTSFTPGVTATREELKELPLSKLEEKLSGKPLGAFGEKTPFMALFSAPPAGVTGHIVKFKD